CLSSCSAAATSCICFSPRDNSRSNSGFKIFYEVVTLDTYSCMDPGIPVNGGRLGHDLSIGASVTFGCEPGYRLSHEETLVCERNHFWNNPLPTVTFGCEPGYRLSHEETLVCERNHFWNNPLPTGRVMGGAVARLRPHCALLFLWVHKMAHGRTHIKTPRPPPDRPINTTAPPPSPTPLHPPPSVLIHF
ncbi:hypothetical protein CRUP_017384, partial [Coryphaenoides rupestris]